MTTLSLIAAVARNGVIGTETGLPWHLSSDLKRFRRLTLDKPIIMGRRTFEHIGKPLDRRINIVVTRRPDSIVSPAIGVDSIESAVRSAGDVTEVMVVGGGEIYRAFLPLVSRMYLTLLDDPFEGTAVFPEPIVVPAGYRWRTDSVEACSADDHQGIGHQFIVAERIEDPSSPGGSIRLESFRNGMG